ncbi:MAG TPA: ATP-binding cassette domain-containing protein [Acidimicrobiales bacterium]|nr:ATP-binding cassette domain-containing protein [Acidimicrobiales bacterium]
MLIAEGLTRRFGEVVALDGLSLRVAPGEVVGFLGPNGSGKTTALRSILGISEPDSGTVTWKGKPVDSDSRRHFGYLPEERGLYPGMKIAEQLAYFAQLYGVEHTRALENAHKLLARLGLGERAEDKVDALSLGNQQRVQLAAALVHEPELLVLDEPFSGLDPISIENVGGILREQADAGVAVVFSSHQLDLVEDFCERVTIVANGRVVAEGDIDDLRRGGDPRLIVQVEGDTTSTWANRLRGVTVVDNADGRLRLRLASTADPQAVLVAAQQRGPVVEFRYEQRRLSEVFREAVEG